MEILRGVAVFVLGGLEGFAFAKSGIVQPQFLRYQMTFDSMGVMRLFLNGVGFSMIGQGLLSLVAPETFDATRFYSKNKRGWARVVGGSFTLGVGMYIGASGPTLIPSQIGAAQPNGVPVLVGGLIGGVVFSLLEPKLFARPSQIVEPKTSSLDGVLGLSYAAAAIPLGAALVAAATFGVDQVLPWAEDAKRMGSATTSALGPLLAGAVIGLNQVPLRIWTSQGQGGSRSVMNLINLLSLGTLAKNYKITKFIEGSQLLYVYGGTLVGAFVAMQTISHPAPLRQFANSTPSTAAAVLGGALMVLGARIAHGCTCGHGISGMSELSLESIAAGMAIFGGGIATGIANRILLGAK